MADINLLQNQLKDTTLVAKKRTRVVVVLSALALILLVGVGGVLYFLTDSKNKETSALNTDNARLQQQINSGDQELTEAKQYQAQLSNIDVLLNNHIAMTPLLEEMGKYTYQRAQFLTVDVDEAVGKVHAEGLVESYENLGKLLLGLSVSGHFENVKLLSVAQAAGEGGGYTFSIDFFAQPELFSTAN
jgi:Tfp pilus assembly protein PilN